MSPPIKHRVHLGQRFGRGVVAAETKVKGYRSALLYCDCGQTYITALSLLLAGGSVSCGCAKRDRVIAMNTCGDHPASTHGLTEHPHYDRWASMMGRCHRPQNKDYPKYGGRGITVCPAWHEPAVFIAYLDNYLGPCPPGHSLDRIDNGQGYKPGNVRWADHSTQNKNRRPFLRGPSMKNRTVA